MKKNKKIVNKTKNNQKLSGNSANGQAIATNGKIAELQQKLATYKAELQYEEALQVIIEFFNLGYVTTELLVETSNLYFLVGDNRRALVWVNKTLEFDDANCQARLLGAKICALEDEMEACFNLLNELIMKNTAIDAATNEKIDELVFYFDDDAQFADTLAKYPELLALSDNSVAKENTGDNSSCIDTPLAPPIMISPDDNENEMIVDEAAAGLTEQASDAVTASDVNEIIAQIMEKKVSLLEKVLLCNSFAMAYCYEDATDSALKVLDYALTLDGNNELILRNLAVLYAELKDKDKALLYFAKLKKQDLALLYKIKNS